MWGVELAVMCVMIVLNGFFAAFEIALASISRSRLEALVHSGRLGAKAAVHMKEDIEWSLAVVQLGITIVGAVAAATAGAGAEESISPWVQSQFGASSTVAQVVAITLVVIPLTLVTIVFGELIPKVFALRNQELVCLRLSPILRGFGRLVYPVVWLLEESVHRLMHLVERWSRKRSATGEPPAAAAYQELKASVAIARTSRLIGTHVENIILRAAELSQRPVSEIMLPAKFMSMLHSESTITDALVLAHMDLHTRFPVTKTPGDPQGVCGYVTFKDIVTYLRFNPHDASISPLIRHLINFSDESSIAHCLERLIRGHAHIALIRNREHEIVGLITLEDLIEELVGDIEDEFDNLPGHMVPIGSGWIVGGGARLSTLAERTKIVLPVPAEPNEIRTVSDWIEARVDGPIHGSEVVETDGIRIVVRKSRRHRVLEALVQSTVTTQHAG